MKHIKNLKEKYAVFQKNENILVITKTQANDSLLSVMNHLEEKIILFTEDFEEKLEEMYSSIQKKCSTLLTRAQKLPNKDTVDSSLVFEIMEELIDTKSLSNESFDNLLNHINNSLDEYFHEDISFLMFSRTVAKDLGDIQEAVKIQELTKRRLDQLSDLVHDVCKKTEEKINSQVFSILDLLDHKYSIFSLLPQNRRPLENSESNYIDTDSNNNYEHTNSSDKSLERIPRTSLELKRHLKNQGFELHRHNGSHQIYKNKEGEVRLIPSRRGNHVLAAKTAKKIYHGVAVANM